MIKKSLKILAILCTVSICSIAQVNAMSLKEALSSSDIALDFGNGGTILCDYINNNGTYPDPGFINKKDYLYDNNTYYLPLNILDLLTNTEGGGDSSIVINSSLLGVNNISLQYSPSNNKVLDSITFTGDNSKYTGMFYLHPAIKSITFTDKNAVISNINVPDVVVNNGKDKESKPFIKSVNPVSICMYLPDNSDFGKLNINGKLTVNLLNKHNKSTYLSFTEINKSFPYSLHIHDKINLIINKNNFYKQKNLRNINITSHSKEQTNKSNQLTSQNNYNNISSNTLINKIKNKIAGINKNINTLNKKLATVKATQSIAQK